MKRLPLLALLFAVAMLLALVAIVVAAPVAPLDPEDCPVGQYLCLTPGNGGYVWCQDGVIDYHQVEPGLGIAYCELPFASERDEKRVFVPIVQDGERP